MPFITKFPRIAYCMAVAAPIVATVGLFKLDHYYKFECVNEQFRKRDIENANERRKIIDAISTETISRDLEKLSTIIDIQEEWMSHNSSQSLCDYYFPNGACGAAKCPESQYNSHNTMCRKHPNNMALSHQMQYDRIINLK